MPAETWCVAAHSETGRGSSGVLCIVWHEKQDSVRASSVASLKQGESTSPLYSRPDTRIMPSAQNEPLTNAGSRSTNAASAAGSRRAIGCGM